jgi:hypothetical protein
MTWEPGDELDQTLPDDQEDFVSDLGEYLREDREWINYISQYLGNLEVSLEDLLDDWISENLSTEVLNSIIANSSTVISLVIESGDFEEAVLALIEPSTGDMAKSVYDPNLIESDAFDMDSMVEGTDTKILTGAERIAITDSASHIIDTLTNPHSITAATVGLDQLTNDAQLKASQLVQTVADEIAEIPSGAAIIDYVTGLGYSGAFDRANHTGTQAASTISDFDTEVSNNTDVSSNTSSRHDAVTVTNSSEINFTLTGQNITASLITGSIDETKLDTSVNDSLNLADSALQSIADESITEPKLAMNDAPSDGEVIAWNSTGSYMEWVGIGSGSGDVVGPASATGDDFAQFDGVTGKLLKDGGLSLTTTLGSPGVDTLIPSEKAVRAAISDAGGGDVSGPSSSVDDRISTFDGETGKLIQDGGKTIADVLSRTNHTGTQAASTISDFDTEVSNNTDVSANTSARHVAASVADTYSINMTLTGQQVKGDVIVDDSTIEINSVNGVQAKNLGITNAKLAGSITIDKIETTDKSGSDGTLITGTKGTNGNIGKWNADGDLIDGGLATSNIFNKSSDDMDDISNGSTYVKTHNDFTDALESKLDGIEEGAEVNNVSDVNATDLTDGGASTLHYHTSDRNRANHTGTQLAATISDFNTAVSLNSDVVANSAFTATPSTVITAGTGIDWDGNTLNVAPNDESITIVSSIGGVSDSLMSASTDVGALFVKNYYVGVDGGGGLFYWSSTTAKTSHNGGTIIDPNHSSTPGQSTWYTNTGATGYGCWIRYTTSIVEVDWFGSKGDGTTNDVYAFRAATTYAATITTKGGTVVYRKRHYINGSLELPYGVTLKGNMSLVGHPTNSQTSHYWNHLPAILLSSSYTITLNGASGIDGALIIKYGLTLPTNSPDSNYSGTAVTAVGEDNFLINSLIIGFDYAFYAQGDNTSVKVQRIRINYLWFDCINGVYIENNNDVVRVTNCHAWQFGSIGATGGIEQDKYARSGNAFHFKGRVDWGIVENCFSYGWYRTVLLESTDPFGIMSMTINNCQSDNGSNAYSGSAGFEVKGSVRDCRFVNCQSSTNAYGLLLSANGGYTPSNIEMRGCHLYSSTTYGISISAGNLSLHDCYFTGIVYAIYTTSSSSKLTVDGCNFNVSSNPAIYCSTANPYIHIYNNCYFNSLSAASYVISPSVIVSPTVTPSGTVLQPPHGVNIVKCGSGNFGTLRGGHKGRVLTIIFTGTSIVYHGTSTYSDMWLPTNVTANNTFASGDTLTLAHAGDQWYEIGRSQA